MPVVAGRDRKRRTRGTRAQVHAERLIGDHRFKTEGATEFLSKYGRSSRRGSALESTYATARTNTNFELDGGLTGGWSRTVAAMEAEMIGFVWVLDFQIRNEMRD
ncbi:dual-specificity RNA methyltransferase RlmN [Striga asiatica]|uniref:Dual-specificity RNA methyltransferase RlmN n=1 Tax=Striga asiatica TaxID=4170 RepID=A0A5A7QCE4_STRAF|nr:dual-specificity RNA methyltransferase RlmN [Striga asiatica]